MLSTFGRNGVKVNGKVIHEKPWNTRKHTIIPMFATPQERNWIAVEVVENGVAPSELETTYGVPRSYTSKQATIYRNCGYFYGKDTVGRPPIIDAARCAEVVRNLNKNKGGYQMKTKEFKEVMKDACNASRAARNICVNNASGLPRRTMYRYEKNMDIHTGNGESTTAARSKACGSMRNMMSFAASNALMVPLTHPQLILNSDATTFEVGYGSATANSKVKYTGKRSECGENLKTEPDKGTSASITAYFIKYYLLCSAGGCAADPVFCVQDPKMAVGAIDVHEVPGLGVSTVHSKAYVVFVKTRACNANFYKWFNTTILIPFVQMQRAVYNINNLAWYQLDGEQAQIDVYNTPEMLATLAEHNESKTRWSPTAAYEGYP